MDKYQDRKLRRDDSINQGIAQSTNTGLQGQNQKDITKMDIASREKVAQMNRDTQLSVAGMPNYIERMVSQMPGKTYEDRLKAYSEIMGPTARGDSAMLTKYLGMNAAQKMQLKQENPQLVMLLEMQLQSSLLKPTDKPSGPVRE